MDFNLKLETVGDDKINSFVKKHHYLKSISRGNKVIFGVYKKETLVGVACFGHPVGLQVINNYGKNTLELKRFVLTVKEKNLASWVLGGCLRYLKQHSLCERVISYADPSQGHEGIIYKASNFKYIGVQKYRTPYMKYKGKRIYTRNIYGGSKQGKQILALIKKGAIKAKVKYADPKHIFMCSFI